MKLGFLLGALVGAAVGSWITATHYDDVTRTNKRLRDDNQQLLAHRHQAESLMRDAEKLMGLR